MGSDIEVLVIQNYFRKEDQAQELKLDYKPTIELD
jgi:hypothetical protein